MRLASICTLGFPFQSLPVSESFLFGVWGLSAQDPVLMGRGWELGVEGLGHRPHVSREERGACLICDRNTE